MRNAIVLMFMLAGLLISPAEAQINIKDKVKNKTNDRVDERTDEGIDNGLNKVEEGVGNLFKKGKNEQNEASSEKVNNESDEKDGKSSPQDKGAKFKSFTRYDFVPGDKILYYEDFSQETIGNFPAFWATNSSGEVKRISIAPGHWLHLNGTDAVYCFTKPIDFPSNFIMEFDIVPDADFEGGFELTFYEEEESKELNDDLYPGIKGLHINFSADKWETKGYNNEADAEWLNGNSETNPVLKSQLNHIIIWIQNSRVRIYHQGAKALDMATNIFAETKFNRFRFSGWDRNAYPFISNIIITTASPDTKSKLLTEGKLISYGIYFDTGRDNVKPESYGSIREIADLLKENKGLRIKIVGHTDSDGNEEKNLDLSKRRAENVKAFLVGDFKIDDKRIETEGKGASEPVETNDTIEGKAKNRRVEFIKL